MARTQKLVKERIDQARKKVIERLLLRRKPITIKEGDKVLVYIGNITDNKLDTLYAGLYQVIKVKGTTVYLALPSTKTYLKFYTSLVKKAPPAILLYDIQNFSRKDEYKVKRILDEK